MTPELLYGNTPPTKELLGALWAVVMNSARKDCIGVMRDDLGSLIATAREVERLKAERANLYKEMQKLTYSFESRQEMEKIFAKVQNV